MRIAGRLDSKWLSMQPIASIQFALLLCAALVTLSRIGFCTYCTENPDGIVRKNLTFLALAPFPEPGRLERIFDGTVVFPAICLAMQHINRDETVLRDYTLHLVEADSGCAKWLNAIVHFTEHVFHGKENVAAVIGPSCAKPSDELGSLAALGWNVTGRPSLLQIGSTTSPSISEDKRYNSFSVTSAAGIVNAFVELAAERKWTRFAAVYDTSPFFLSIFNEVQKRLGDKIVFSIGINDDFLPRLEGVRGNKARVIYAFVSRQVAAELLCYALHLDITFPTFQWVFHSRSFGELVAHSVTVKSNGETYICDREEMVKASRGVILNEITFGSITSEVAGTNFRKYEEGYLGERERYIKELGEQNASNETEYSQAYYDAVWAMAIAMNSSLPELEEKGYDLAEYNYEQANATAIIRKHVLETNFQGLSGPFTFNATTRTNLGVDVKIIQIRPDLKPPDQRIGTYAYFPNSTLSLCEDALWIDSSEFHVTYEGWHDAQTYTVLLNILVVLVSTVLLHLANIFLGQHRSIKATSTNLNHVIFSGCYLFIIAAMIFVFFSSFVINRMDRLTDTYRILYGVQCNMYVWCGTIGYTLIFGTVCAKTWRIYRIFSYFRRPRNILISDKSLIAFVMVMMLVDLVLLTVLSFTNPWHLHYHETFDGEQVEVQISCDFSDLPPALIVLLLFKAAQSVLVVLMAVMTRKVHKNEYKSTKVLNALIYVLFMFNGVVVVLYIAFRDSRVVTQLLLLYVLIVVISLCDVLLFVPPVLPVLKKKREELLSWSRDREGTPRLRRTDTTPTVCVHRV